jgi:glycosyltransferase involved in cell wall biosynthesis
MTRDDPKMRILHSYIGFVPAKGFGGPVKVVDNLTQELSRRGHKVAVVCSNFDNRRESLFGDSRVENRGSVQVHYISSLSLGKKGYIVSGRLLNWVYANLHEWDLVHIHGYRNYYSTVISLAADLAGVPYVLEPHGTLPAKWHRSREKRVFDWLVGNRMLLHAAKVIALTETEAEQVFQLGITESKVDVIPNGFSAEIGVLPNPGAFRERIGLDNTACLILFLGRLHAIKRIDRLLRAVRLLDDHHATLAIVGPDEGELEQLCALARELDILHRVHFVGYLSGLEKYQALVDADVFVLPSEYDAFPVAVLEACWSGTPVVVAEQSGIAPLVAESRAGLVVAGQPESVASAISSILGCSSLRSKLSAGCSTLLAQLDITTVCDMLEACYENAYSCRRFCEN